MLSTLLERYLVPLDQTMRDIIATHVPAAPEFDTMLRYALGWIDEHGDPYDKPTGKRLRPLLMLLANQSAGGDWHYALPAAAAVELLHNFSLIHDDIQDQSLTRHNRPTVWEIWGIANAINAGDAMFTTAYAALESMSAAIAPQTMLALWRIFNATNLELTRGQHLDMRFEHLTTVSVEDYISMIQGKSAALLSACAQIGALIATGDEVRAKHYATFGLNLGLAFQIRDDVIGIWGDPTKTGKSAATDIISRKKSLPVLYGLAQSEALRTLYAKLEFDDADVLEAVHLLDEVNAQEYTMAQEVTFYQRAETALEAAQPQGDYLRGFVDFLIKRDY